MSSKIRPAPRRVEHGAAICGESYAAMDAGRCSTALRAAENAPAKLLACNWFTMGQGKSGENAEPDAFPDPAASDRDGFLSQRDPSATPPRKRSARRMIAK